MSLPRPFPSLPSENNSRASSPAFGSPSSSSSGALPSPAQTPRGVTVSSSENPGQKPSNNQSRKQYQQRAKQGDSRRKTATTPHSNNRSGQHHRHGKWANTGSQVAVAEDCAAAKGELSTAKEPSADNEPRPKKSQSQGKKQRDVSAASTANADGSKDENKPKQQQQNGRRANKNPRHRNNTTPTLPAAAIDGSEANIAAAADDNEQKKAQEKKHSRGRRGTRKNNNRSHNQQQKDDDGNKNTNGNNKPAPASESATNCAEPSSSAVEQAAAAVAVVSPATTAASRSLTPNSGLLPQAMIVSGENGRARVLFNPHSEHAPAGPAPLQLQRSVSPAQHQYQRTSGAIPRRASMAAAQLGSRNKYPVQFADNMAQQHHQHLGLGAVQPPVYQTSRAHNGARATSVSNGPAVPFVPGSRVAAVAGAARQRSVSSTQFRDTAYHQQAQHQQQHPRRISSAAAAIPEDVQSAADDTAGARGRSQTVSSHMSMTGLRISMAQSRPGNVLAPHVPLLSRGAANGVVQTNTYANGGYFATRRSSVSNVGLAVDPSHSIRIPAIMFQKPSPEEPHASSTAAAAQPPAASAATGDDLPAVSSTNGGNVTLENTGALDAPTTTAQPQPRHGADDARPGAGTNESLAMKRLQDMISSMRALGHPQQQQQQQQKPRHQQSANMSPHSIDAISSKIEALPIVSLPPTPAAHPTSRFDSILEEDEDDDEDEDELEDGEIVDASSATATATATSEAPAKASTPSQSTASHTLDSQSKQQAHILFAV
ncbi:hypothetical protein GGI12_004416 [Dipsacomyces acuminosporus]|nr:hypothetical protein GGI12_004416 [Dipsacomyces acuminosporus]